MCNLCTYQRHWHDYDDQIDSHIRHCIGKKHPESVYAFLLECPERGPIGFEVLAASRGNCDEESHNPQDDDYHCDPADNVKFAAAEYSPIEKTNGEFQKSKCYRMYQIEGSLELVRTRE